MHWEYVRTMYRVTKEVKDMLVNTSCVNGQGTEFHIEEDIQRVVRGCHGRKSRLDYPNHCTNIAMANIEYTYWQLSQRFGSSCFKFTN